MVCAHVQGTPSASAAGVLIRILCWLTQSVMLHRPVFRFTGSRATCLSPGTLGPGTLRRAQAVVERRLRDCRAPAASGPMRRAAPALVLRAEFRPHRGLIDNRASPEMSAERTLVEIAEAHIMTRPRILPSRPPCRRRTPARFFSITCACVCRNRLPYPGPMLKFGYCLAISDRRFPSAAP